VRFLGGKHRCLSSVPERGDRCSFCIRNAPTLHRNDSSPSCSHVNPVRTYSNECKCILSYAALRCRKPAARELGAGTSDRGGQDKARKVRAVGRDGKHWEIPAIQQTLRRVRRTLRLSATRYRRSTFDTP
jgi:hypothetical protein